MELPDRKMRILKAIVRNYLETGEPVGSRTISKLTDLKLSSATIRNEMADLEEMGLITQPHTSAGRIPTDAGYRLYVDDMLNSEKEELQSARREMLDMKDLLLEKQDRLEIMLQKVAKTLAVSTNYASMISSPTTRSSKIKFIQLSQVDPNNVLAVIVIEGNLIRNKVIPVEEELSAENMLKLNMLLNTNLCGLAVEEITLGLIEGIKRNAGIHTAIINDVIDAAAEIVRSEEELKIYTSGANNIFKYPELADHQRASEIISDFEEKQALGSIVQETLAADGEKGIQVYIGDEMPVARMRDCSVVTATYELGEGMKGTIGIIGPKRMDYDKVVSVLQTIMSQLDALYKPGSGQPDKSASRGESQEAAAAKPDQPFTIPEIRIPQIKRIEIKEM
ncbi:MAG: heat-inducible transcription repressor HrcA [Lachnospiraceae bacterium]|nr:heat-inducible transcription repressor HrcA [Lachnospiraceae bacterium]